MVKEEIDASSCSDEPSSTNSSTNQTSGRESDETSSEHIKQTLGQRESKAVFKLRLLVFIILLMAGIAVSVVVFFITRNSELEEFEHQYEGTASKVIDSYEGIITRIGSISSVGVAATIHGMDRAKNGNWPFVTLSSFQQRSATARLLSGAHMVRLSPIVTEENRDKWEKYVVGEDKAWIKEGLDYQEEMDIQKFDQPIESIDDILMTNYSSKPIFYYDSRHEATFDVGPGPYLPSWQTSPVLVKGQVNENLLRSQEVASQVKHCWEDRTVVLGNFQMAPPGDVTSWNATTAMYSTLCSIDRDSPVGYFGDPFANVFIPVFDSFEKNRKVVAVMVALVHFKHYFLDILPQNVNGIHVVLENTCDGFFTYELHGPKVEIIGSGDLHETAYTNYEQIGTFLNSNSIADGTQHGLNLDHEGCEYILHVYPTDEFYKQYATKTPILITFAVAMVFLFAILMFVFYDKLVERRQRIVLSKAVQSTAIVSSLFPKQVRDRLMAESDENNGKKGNFVQAPGRRLKTYLNGDTKTESGGSQIADLFPQCTVLFADIAGFTAWSSTREPEQVFVLLQTLYAGFDKIAKRRHVFKVETIGDCYLAVTGLPEPQHNHAIIMARFAWECKLHMRQMTRELEVTLGPDTGDLTIRIGLNSGPVTAGVLRGDRARFQLFGDTVNTASRMESSGVRDKIQISQSTADIIVASGKAHWVKPREDTVQAKGKGIMATFWLNPGAKHSSATSSSDRDSTSDGAVSNKSDEETEHSFDHIRQERQIDWMVELLSEHIRKMAAKRDATKMQRETHSMTYTPPDGSICLDEVKEVIHIASYDACIANKTEHWSTVEIKEEVLRNLREYVSIIAKTYRSNPFHNFEHACHVTMSVNKLLKRIVAPELSDEDLEKSKKDGNLEARLHDYTYGISSDPLTSFAIVFSALIHDVDHRGCSNVQLIKEEEDMGNKYRKKSVAEQNSLDIAWSVLMMDQFESLRKFVFVNHAELLRFRQLIVNTVLATDIFDKELNDLRKARWMKAFQQEKDDAIKGNSVEESDLKATIVIEHIIQASDVSHTMQHWHVYRKWNMRLFREMRKAYLDGRMMADPAQFWYKGELGFFDNYILPLAKKLRECNVFGVSSDEYLNYAVCNRAEWAEKGESIVAEIMSEIDEDLKDENL